MLDHFLSAVYQTDKKHQEKRAFVEQLKKLPPKELMKIASGELKLSYPHGGDHGGVEWLEKFKGTPLFEQAMQLEQAAIHADMEQQQRRQQRQQEYRLEDDLYSTQDQICLQKRLLELQLMQLGEQSMQATASVATLDPQKKKRSTMKRTWDRLPVVRRRPLFLWGQPLAVLHVGQPLPGKV
jgi:hypothetical protein